MRSLIGFPNIVRIVDKNSGYLSSLLLTRLNNSPVIGAEAEQRRNARQVRRQTILHKEVINRSKLEKMVKTKEESLGSVDTKLDPDMPICDMTNPYEKPYNKCILCEHNIDVDYKNIRLLSQFVSPYTGKIYGRQHTGLCLFMQKRVSQLIKRARVFGFLPYQNKDPRFLYDPKLFDPFAPKRK